MSGRDVIRVRLALSVVVLIGLVAAVEGLQAVVPPCAVLHDRVVCLPGIEVKGITRS
jgi:hypothetical protein